MRYRPLNEDVVISRPGYTLPSTVCLPASDGAAPCVVFFGGSGPTDRDWTSPLLPGRNGSGAQLALALQARGVGSIRFDKVGSGVNLISLSGPSRSLLDTAIEQFRAMRVKAGADGAVVDAALADFHAAMLDPDAPAPDLSALPEATALRQAAHAPVQQRVARELILADPLVSLAAYRGRALVVSAANDAQVPGSDADRIFAALGSAAEDKTRLTIADANHVYKSETRAPSTISQAEIVAGYADDGHPLSDGLVNAIVDFVSAT